MVLIITKIGGWPTHKWYMWTIENIRIKMTTIIVLITWQKILPAFMLTAIRTSNPIWAISMAIIRSFLPLTKVEKNIRMKSIIALSSVMNNGWIIVAIRVSIKAFIVFIAAYRVTTALTLSFFESTKKKHSRNKEKPWERLTIVRNLRGIPPFLIFWGKLYTLKESITRGIKTEIILTLIVIRSFIVYNYTWRTITEVGYTKKKTQMKRVTPREKKETTTLAAASSTYPLLLLILGATPREIYLDRIKPKSLQMRYSVKHVNLWSWRKNHKDIKKGF